VQGDRDPKRAYAVMFVSFGNQGREQGRASSVNILGVIAGGGRNGEKPLSSALVGEPL
jgi:hypothetical protein